LWGQEKTRVRFTVLARNPSELTDVGRILDFDYNSADYNQYVDSFEYMGKGRFQVIDGNSGCSYTATASPSGFAVPTFSKDTNNYGTYYGWSLDFDMTADDVESNCEMNEQQSGTIQFFSKPIGSGDYMQANTIIIDTYFKNHQSRIVRENYEYN
jgi:hypothetical protein